MYVAVAEFEVAALASLLISRLAGAGFHPAPLSEARHIQVAGVDRVFTVEVPPEERAAVMRFLHENGYAKNAVSR